MSPSNYPAAVAYVVNLIMAAVVAFKIMPVSTAHYVAVAVVALTSLVVVFLVKPIAVPAATGAFNTLIVAVSAFGFHLSAEQLAAAVGIFGFVVAFVTHQLVIPTVALKAGRTANERELGRTL
jgi:hypothetical protein